MPRILEDLACPACGYRSLVDPDRTIADNRIRAFCDGCGAFVTIVLSEGQADALRRRSLVANVG